MYVPNLNIKEEIRDEHKDDNFQTNITLENVISRGSDESEPASCN